MDISTQSAICQLQPSRGVGVDDPYPCHLFWRNDSDLIIGWADSCKILRIEEGNSDLTSTTKIARTIISWQADCIICGMFPLDDDHLVYLGYSPPDENEMAEFSSLSVEETAREFTNEPELIVANTKTGEIVSADVLPLRGVNMDGPFAYFLLSTYQCQNNGALDSLKWKLKNYEKTRGGDRGNAPLLFVLSSEDMIVARIRDVNDRVRVALEEKNLKLAIEIAMADRTSLRIYSFSDLLSVYLNHLLEKGTFLETAQECARLIQFDTPLWSIWIERFIQFHQLPTLCPFIPLEKPRLDNSIYEGILIYLMETNSRYFLDLLKKWSKIKPTLFDHSVMIDRLHSLISSRQSSTEEPTNRLYHFTEEDEMTSHSLSTEQQQQNRTYFLAAQAHLYMISKEFVKALNAYLQMNMNELSLHEESQKNGPEESNSPLAQVAEHRQIFDLIEKESLFTAVENKIVNLIRISKELAGKLLVNNADKLPIKSIANQLSSDRRLLHWYLHLIFTDPTTREIYSDATEFSELHKKQVKLYAEFAPSFSYKRKDFSKEVVDVRSPEAILERKNIFETSFINFIKSGLVDLNYCLQECLNHQPKPLYPEMIFIFSVKGDRRKALNLLLTEMKNVSLAIDVIEDEFDSIMLVEGTFRRNAQRFNNPPVIATVPEQPSADSSSSSSNFIQKELNSNNNNLELWNDLISYCLEHAEYLPELFDNLGISKINTEMVLKSLKQNASVPLLKQRIIRMLQSLVFKENILFSSKGILQDDALNLLCQKNHGQRRAIKIEPAIRCSACLRPLSFEAGQLSVSSVVSEGQQPNNHLRNLLPVDKNQIQIWGTRSYNSSSPTAALVTHRGNGTIVFSNKLAFHKVCYEKIPN
jgi:hypothetical protein